MREFEFQQIKKMSRPQSRIFTKLQTRIYIKLTAQSYSDLCITRCAIASSGAPPFQLTQLARVRPLAVTPSSHFAAARQLDRDRRTTAPRLRRADMDWLALAILGLGLPRMHNKLYWSAPHAYTNWPASSPDLQIPQLLLSIMITAF